MQTSSMKSPSKLRVKFTLSHHQMKLQDISNSINSSRTAPSHLQDSEFVNNLLASQNSQNAVMQPNKAPVARGSTAAPQFRMQHVGKSDLCNPSSVHPVRVCGDEKPDYDSTSSFEFYKGEKSQRRSRPKYLSAARPVPSKWNDAEKWILNKKNNAQNQVNSEFLSYEIKPSMKRADFPCPASRTGQGKFVFGSTGTIEPNTGQGKEANAFMDFCLSKDVTDVADAGISIPSMRDMGTEMTPIPSQEPSRSPTPVGATTPLRSPTSSLPSSPQTREPALIPTERSTSKATHNLGVDGGKELSEQEMKHKVTREIVALGMHLGKMNIVAWASKHERERNIVGNKVVDVDDEGRRAEYRTRAAAWEEAKKSKHEARFKREETRLQAWASRQQAKSEAVVRRTEARIERMRAKAQAKIAMKMASVQRKAEEKRAAAEARKNRQHKKTAARAKYISRTGRVPSTYFSCYWWSRRSHK